MRFTQESCGTTGTIVDSFAQGGFDDMDHGSNQWPWSVVLATIATSIAHVLDLGLVEMGEFVLLLLRLEMQFINQFQGIPQGIAALKFVLYLPKNLSNLVFDGIWGGSTMFESTQVREKLSIHILDQIITGQGCIVIKAAF